MKRLTPVLIALFLVISCQKDNEDFVDITDVNANCEDCNIDITLDENRLELFNSDVNLVLGKAALASKNDGDTLELVLKAKLNPLIIDYNGEEKMLNANHISVRNDRVAASYSIVGEPYGGAVDIIDIPKNKEVTLEGTLLIPDKDIDAVDWDSRTKLMFGGGLNVDLFPEAESSSFFEYYSINGNTRNPDEFNLNRLETYSTRFGNKLNSLKDKYGFIIGSGGGSDGNVFIYNSNTKTVFQDDSNLLSGLYIFDTTIAKKGTKRFFVVVAYDASGQELKAFYFDINKQSYALSYMYDVSLGNFNLNVEAKHSILAPRADALIVSLEQEGIGVFKIEEIDGVKTAVLNQQLKEDILNQNNPDEVVNSFSASGGVLYAAAGAGGVLILRYKNTTTSLVYAYKVEVPGESVNSTSRSDDNLVVASTSGVRVFKINKN